MKQNGSGWHGESRRHSLARKGVKTGRKPMRSQGKEFEGTPDDVLKLVHQINAMPMPLREIAMKHLNDNVDVPKTYLALDTDLFNTSSNLHNLSLIANRI